MPEKPFLTDVKTLRERARQHIQDGAVTPGYGGDTKTAIKLLNDALATEIVCVLRYKLHYFVARGIHSGHVADEFLEHANDEQAHADRIAERIVQLGGDPDLSPKGLLSRSHTEYVETDDLAQMIKENLVADRIAERIVQLGGDPDLSPKGLLSRSHTESVETDDLAQMIKENLVAERIAIDSYRELVDYFASFDPTSRKMLEEI